MARSRDAACPGSAAGRAPTYAAAALGSAFIGLTGATLTWVVCCATPSWVVALTMLGMSASLALWLSPLGAVLKGLGLLMLVGVVAAQVRRLSAARTGARP